MSRDKTLAFMAAAILATNILMMKMGHRATWDIFCHTFMLGGLWAFMDGMRNNRGWPVFAIFGTFMGLSFMSKGPVSFFALLLPFVLSYIWIFRTGEFRIKWRLILLAFAICIFISGLWPFYIWTFHHEALLTTVSKESSAWINLHLQPFWYYSKFPVYSGLWLVVTIAALIKPFAEKRVKSIPDYQFFLLWLVLDILLLSVVPEKKLRYLLPAMIPMAMLGGTVLRAVMDNYSKGRPEKGDSMVISLHACFISIIGVFFPSAVFYRVYIAGGKENPGWFILVFAAFFAVVVFSWLFYRKKNVPGLLSLTIVQCCLIAASHWHFYQGVYFTNPDYKIMENIDSSVLPPSTTIFLMEAREGTKYVWDLKRQIKRWNVEQAKSLLDSGETIAVISVGDPDRALHEAINGDVEVQIVDRFDYRIKSPQQEKTVLSLVRSRR
jgi:4-amino-4-deoxy-L-arabinose transferase-like glycosyltransferase